MNIALFVPSFPAVPAALLSALTPDVTSILAAILAVAAVLIGVTLAIYGYHIVRDLITGERDDDSDDGYDDDYDPWGRPRQ